MILKQSELIPDLLIPECAKEKHSQTRTNRCVGCNRLWTKLTPGGFTVWGVKHGTFIGAATIVLCSDCIRAKQTNAKKQLKRIEKRIDRFLVSSIKKGKFKSVNKSDKNYT